MPKDAAFTVKLESELHAAFLSEAANEDRAASCVMRDLMRSYVEQRRKIREYDDYIRCKVEAGRASMRAGLGRTNEDVEAAFVARRNGVVAEQA